jgi:hypothetical protein
VEKGFKEMGFNVERKELPMLSEGEDASGSESGDESGSEDGSENAKRAKLEHA